MKFNRTKVAFFVNYQNVIIDPLVDEKAKNVSSESKVLLPQ